jgi:hypothetical protein
MLRNNFFFYALCKSINKTSFPERGYKMPFCRYDDSESSDTDSDDAQAYNNRIQLACIYLTFYNFHEKLLLNLCNFLKMSTEDFWKLRISNIGAISYYYSRVPNLKDAWDHTRIKYEISDDESPESLWSQIEYGLDTFKAYSSSFVDPNEVVVDKKAIFHGELERMLPIYEYIHSMSV